MTENSARELPVVEVGQHSRFASEHITEVSCEEAAGAVDGADEGCVLGRGGESGRWWEGKAAEDLDGFVSDAPGGGGFGRGDGVGHEAAEGGAEAVGRGMGEELAGADVGVELGAITGFDEDGPLEVEEDDAAGVMLVEGAEAVEHGIVECGVGVVIVEGELDELGHVEGGVVGVE